MVPLQEIIGSLDSDSQAPLYRQLQDRLRTAIEENLLDADHPLPAERDFASDFGVSRITVRKALEGLVEEGLLRRRHGAGTFVEKRVEKNFSQLSSFSEEMAARGQTADSEWLRKVKDKVTAEEVMNFGLSPNMSVYRFDRLRFGDGAPLLVEYAIVPAFCLPSVDSVKDTLYGALSEAGFKPVRALQRLRAVIFDAEMAALLHAKKGDPGLLVERRGFLADGRVVEVSRSYYRGDTYDFVAELDA